MVGVVALVVSESLSKIPTPPNIPANMPNMSAIDATFKNVFSDIAFTVKY